MTLLRRSLKLLLLISALGVFAEVNRWPVLDRLAAAVLALVTIAYLWSRLSLRGVVVRREPRNLRAEVGQTFAERIVLHNTGRLGKLWVEVRDFSALPGHQASRVVRVRGRSETSWWTETRCERRGVFRIGPLVARAGDPFGIFPASFSAPAAGDLIVYPAAVDLSGFPLPGGALPLGRAMERRNPFVSPSVAGVRDYATGDPYNRISWSATARRGRLMVKEFDLDPAADLWLVLDLDRQTRVAATRRSPFARDGQGRWPAEAWLDVTDEYAVTIAASLARATLDGGRNVGLVASGAHVETLPPDRSHRQRVAILETLAIVTANGDRPLAEVLEAERRRFTRHSSVVVITSATDDAWVPALAEIAEHRVPVSVVIVEADTFGPAPSALMVVGSLLACGVPVYLVKYGDPIAAALASAHGTPTRTTRRLGTARG